MQHDTLLEQLHAILPAANLRPYTVAGTPIELLLLDDSNMHRHLSDEETAAAWNEAPYWLFCWASGVALAQYLLANPETVKNKTVIDVGSGSGIVAIAAAMADAKRVVACDIDPLACKAIRCNSARNGLDFEISSAPVGPTQRFDLVLAADVLYDGANHPLLALFKKIAPQVLIADSRLKTLPAKPYEEFGYRERLTTTAVTIPDLGELEIHKQVKIFHYGCKQTQ